MARAGNYRDRITIKTPTRAALDSYGSPRPPRGAQSGDRATVAAAVAAEIRGLRGQELYTGVRETGNVTHHIEMRYRAGLKAHMEVYELYGEERVFDIQAVRDPDGRRRVLVLDAKEMPEWRTA